MELRQRLESALAGRYAVGREIGRGGMAIVFIARDARHERDVALKVLRPELAAALGPERFLREIKLAAGLAHPNILPLYDSGEAEGCLYYVMPYVAGESLRDRLEREGHLRLQDALGITREVCDALAYAHRAGVVHRDIKPENILLLEGHAVLADFGIARAISAAGGSRKTEGGLVVGTPAYMSPEQAVGDDVIDARSDIYSLGCVTFEMLAGRPPFHGTTPQRVLTRKLEEQAPDLRKIALLPQAVGQAVTRALERDPERRFQTALAFADALGTEARGTLWRSWLGGRKGRLMAAGAVIALSGLALLLRRRAVLNEREFDPMHIAVLYFDARGDSAPVERVATGITEDLIDALNQVPTVTVISAAGVRPWRGMHPPPDSVARALRVGTIVSGDVELVRDTFYVAVRLVEAVTGEQLHARAFRQPYADLHALEDSLTASISEFLRRRLGETMTWRARRAATRSFEAWDLVRRSIELQEYARALSMNDGAAAGRAFREADSLAARAAALDPRWPEPLLRRGWIAWSEAILATSHTPAGSQAERAARLAAGLEYANQVLGMASENARALELRGFLHFQKWTLTSSDTLLRAAAEADLRAAVRADPDRAIAWYTLSELLSSEGELVEAEAAARKAYEKDAFLAEAEGVAERLFAATLERGQVTEADRWCREGHRRFPSNPNFLECRLTLLGWAGRGRAAITAAWQQFDALDTIAAVAQGRPYRLLLIANVLARSGWRDSAVALVRTTRRRYPRTELDLQEAAVQLLVGDRDSALQLLATLLKRHPGYRGYVANHYWFRVLHRDPRFEAMTSRGEP